MGCQDKGVCLRTSHDASSQHKDMIWHTATYFSNSDISIREYYGEEKNLSDFIKERNASREHISTIMTDASSKLIEVFFVLVILIF